VELEGTVGDCSVEGRAEKQLVSAARSVVLLFAFLAAGCASVEPAAPVAPPHTGTTQSGVAAVEPGHPANVPVTQAKGQSASKTDLPAAKGAAKVATPPAPAEEPRKKVVVAPALEKQQASPPLDLASLESRLKETKAIGLISKIALKNQVDDLLDQFRAYYQGSIKTTLAELRQRYDLLLLKVLSLLQDDDQSLATAIGASREAIWGILADRQKFATI